MTEFLGFEIERDGERWRRDPGRGWLKRWVGSWLPYHTAPDWVVGAYREWRVSGIDTPEMSAARAAWAADEPARRAAARVTADEEQKRSDALRAAWNAAHPTPPWFCILPTPRVQKPPRPHKYARAERAIAGVAGGLTLAAYRADLVTRGRLFDLGDGRLGSTANWVARLVELGHFERHAVPGTRAWIVEDDALQSLVNEFLIEHDLRHREPTDWPDEGDHSPDSSRKGAEPRIVEGGK